MSATQSPVRCQAKRTNGQQCQLSARPGTELCHFHTPGIGHGGHRPDCRCFGCGWRRMRNAP